MKRILVLFGMLTIALSVVSPLPAQSVNQANGYDHNISQPNGQRYTVELVMRDGYVEELQPLPPDLKVGDQVRYESDYGDVQIDFTSASPFTDKLITDSNYHTIVSDGQYVGRCYITGSDGTLYKYSERRGGSNICTSGGNGPVHCRIPSPPGE